MSAVDVPDPATSAPEAPQAPEAPAPQASPAAPSLTAESLSQALSQVLPGAFSQAVTPLIPKPPEATPLWETDDFYNDRKVFLEGINKLLDSRFEKYHKEKIESIARDLGLTKELLPQLMVRAAEDPQYSGLDATAREIQKEVPGLTYWQAFQVAKRQAAKSPIAAPKARSVPPHLSSPDTKQTSIPNVPDKGPATMKNIVASLRAKYGNDIPDEALE